MESKQTDDASFLIQFQEILSEHEQACMRAGQRPATIRNRRWQLPKFLHFLSEAGVDDLSQIRPLHLSDFLISQQHYAPNTIGTIACTLRTFLRYLQQRGILQKDLAAAVPQIRYYQYAKIPTVWSAEEVERLLAQVDRGSPRGKRDYAILLLASRLGIRVGDIVQLRLEHLHWETKQIIFPQSKTRQPLVLPMTEEVGWALIEYLRHSRPAVDHREVFLWCRPPFSPFVQEENLRYLVNKYRRRAGIFVPTGQPIGMHTLRHSLASRLLNESTPLTTIADILGHANSESTLIYTKVDLPHLQACALDPEEVSHA